MKKIILLLIAILPNKLKRWAYQQFFDYDIHPTARIGLVFLDAKNVTIEANAWIAHFNIIRNLERFYMGEHSRINKWNTITACPKSSTRHFVHETERMPAFILGKHSAVLQKHYFDCCNTITIGTHTIIAGLRSSFISHSINLENNRQETSPITVGSYCMIGASCVLLRGSHLPDYSALGANSTLHKAYTETHSLYSGVPAKRVRELDPTNAYFHRETGFVD